MTCRKTDKSSRRVKRLSIAPGSPSGPSPKILYNRITVNAVSDRGYHVSISRCEQLQHVKSSVLTQTTRTSLQQFTADLGHGL